MKFLRIFRSHNSSSARCTLCNRRRSSRYHHRVRDGLAVSEICSRPDCQLYTRGQVLFVSEYYLLPQNPVGCEIAELPGDLPVEQPPAVQRNRKPWRE